MTDTVTMQRPAFFQLRTHEFARLDATGQTYLDYAGSALYPASLVRAHADLLARSVFGNPHSDSPSARASSALIEDARARVLAFFDADPAEYCVVFTANTSAAARLVAEGFPFTDGSSFVLTVDNHNSINGIRMYAERGSARVRYVPLDNELRAINIEHALKPGRAGVASLFAFPAQSNFSGVQQPMRCIATAQQRGYRVLLDAAAFAPTHPLSLREVRPDFVTVSFYKMFGFPTGVGALIARHDALAALSRPWFAGGTVDFVSVQNDLHMLKAGVEGFEDGTANFLGIAGVSAGLDFLENVGMRRIQRHVAELTLHALDQLSTIEAVPGSRAGVVLHGPRDGNARGGTIAFNLMDARGRIIPYEHVEAHARAAGISIRGGCFCNPGAAERALAIPRAPARAYLESALTRTRDFSMSAFRDAIGGSATGALRCSLGMASNRPDIDTLIRLLRELI
jgi:selenocysteine lyase/cysteine desulfurase